MRERPPGSLFKTARGRAPSLRPGTMSKPAAQDLGARALLFLAEDEGRLIRFLSETGLDPAGLQEQAGTDTTLAAVLGHLLDDESLLLVFTSAAAVEPEDVQSARASLGGTATWDSV